MEFDKITSDLTMMGNIIKKIDVKNDIVGISDTAKKMLGFEVINFETSEDSNEHIGRLEIEVMVSAESEEGKTDIDIVVEGCFSAPGNIDIEKFKELVTLNGAAALYSICRAKVETITAAIYYTGKLTLPFINIYDYYREASMRSELQSSDI